MIKFNSFFAGLLGVTVIGFTDYLVMACNDVRQEKNEGLKPEGFIAVIEHIDENEKLMFVRTIGFGRQKIYWTANTIATRNDKKIAIEQLQPWYSIEVQASDKSGKLIASKIKILQ